MFDTSAEGFWRQNGFRRIFVASLSLNKITSGSVDDRDEKQLFWSFGIRLQDLVESNSSLD
jgi:hypothetical protein